MRLSAPGVEDTFVPGIMEAGSFCGTPMQLRQAVLDQIVTYPQTHDQRDWVSDCGTTACVAGWALILSSGHLPAGEAFDILEEAQELLELSDYDAIRLFHYTNNSQACHALKFLANGDPVDWEEVGHKLSRTRNEHQVNLMVKHDMGVYRGTIREPRHFLPDTVE